MAGDAIVLDSGALTAFVEGGQAIRVALQKELIAGSEVRVPTAVVAESATGESGRDARLNRALKSMVLVDLDERTARRAAALRHANRFRRSGTIDAIVIATADGIPRTRVLTTDADDLRPLAAVNRRSVVVSVG